MKDEILSFIEKLISGIISNPYKTTVLLCTSRPQEYIYFIFCFFVLSKYPLGNGPVPGCSFCCIVLSQSTASVQDSTDCQKNIQPVKLVEFAIKS